TASRYNPFVATSNEHPGKEPRVTSEGATLAHANPEEGSRERTPLPFWKMTRADDTAYWLPYIKNQDRPVANYFTDRPAASSAKARPSLGMSRLALRGGSCPLPGLVVDRCTHRRCRMCRRVYPLRDFVRSWARYGTVKDDWKTCNPYTRICRQ